MHNPILYAHATNNMIVGQFVQQSKTYWSFSYSDEWLAYDSAFPISLSLPLVKGECSSFNALNFIHNLLPDLKEERLSLAHSVGVQSNDVFNLLSKIGHDCTGGISFTENRQAPNIGWEYREVSASELNELVTQRKSFLPFFGEYRPCISGTQRKTTLTRLNGKWYVPQEKSISSHIIKYPMDAIVQSNSVLDMSSSVENEFICNQIAKELGFSVPDIEIITAESGAKALVVERFDRCFVDGVVSRRHQEDFCQIFGVPEHQKYQSENNLGVSKIVDVLSLSAERKANNHDFFKFMVLQCLLGATDGHLKNFSVHIAPGGHYQLAPFYDLLSAYPAISATGLNKRKLKLAMGLKASRGYKYHINKICLRHIEQTANQFGISNANCHEIISAFLAQFSNALSSVDNRFPEKEFSLVKDAIFQHASKIVEKLSRSIK
ncbi:MULTISPECIES: HipA domain-containing protein [Vibrio harveyi group]|uniref:HipA domain-containing protein n=1 Tax=Vibrio harveyi group TaxID=717610 RepID=UPI001559332E|nr:MULTISPECIES: HipA domain-containing protein [Vibrio harveyi group]HBC3532280.1 HipA domain-containing protein [Vibrio vulnificus]MCG9741278.1 HipA domain-containing protein [Vibrio alginolyticus]MDF5024903.1 HipA domain-containing protein [Vibrio parahaemolyticus]MDF5059063.1 HipA domain-containing protein [Vibrio parahaemolyticus]MDF5193493.1 HipA domain-containing protein [Vibrio parahaemolyticus]